MRPSHRRLIPVALVALAVVGLAFLPSLFWADLQYFWVKAHGMGWHHLPYRDFVWEFPPATVLVVLPARFLPVDAFTYEFAITSALCTWVAVRVLSRARPGRETQVVRMWLFVGAPLFAVSWYRFDGIAVLLVCSALVAYEQGRRGAGVAAAGFAMRLWPVVLAAVPAVRRQRDDVVRTLGLVVVIVAAWYAFSPGGFADFLRFRQGAGYQVESLLGAIGLALGRPPSPVSGAWIVRLGALDQLDKILTLAWGVTAIVATVRLRRMGGDPVRLAGGLVLALVVSSRVLSPQYLLWGLPFVVLAGVDGDDVVARGYLVAGVLTVVELYFYYQLFARNPAALFVLFARNAVLVWCAVHELRAAFQPKHAFDRFRDVAVGSVGWQTRSSSGAPASTT